MPKVLIADDSAELLQILSFILNKEGFEACAVSTSNEVLDGLTSFAPDVVLLDIRLGRSDGRQLCREIKQNHPGIPVILLSASPELLRTYAEYLADDVIEKPFEIKTVMDKINTRLKPKT